MAIYRGAYYSASSCTGSARPGAKALMAWYLGAYGARGAANLGIYVCKTLGSGYSIHGHGRACDMGTNPYNNPGGNWPTWGWALANALLNNSKELGIQLIIFRGKVWSCRYPDAGWRTYNGSDPHNGHMHVELIPDTAASLTVDRIQSVLGGATPNQISGGIMLPKKGDTGPDVGYWQRMLIAAGEKLPKYGVDEKYGDEMTAAVASWFKKNGSGTTYHGRQITSWIALNLQRQVFRGEQGDRGPAGPAGPAGKDGVLTLPATVEITGQVTSFRAGA